MAEQDTGRRRSRSGGSRGDRPAQGPPADTAGGAERRRARRPSSPPAQTVSPTGSRQRQRAAERARRRSLRRRRIALASVIVIVALGLALGLSRVLSGGDELATDPADGATATSEPMAKEGTFLVRVDQAGAMVAVVFVSSADPAAMLGLPGATLVRGPTGFAPLSDLWADDPTAAAAAAADLIGMEASGLASVEWSAVIDGLASGGVEAEYPGDPVPWAAETGTYVAEAFATLGSDAAGVEVLRAIISGDEAAGAAEAVAAVAVNQGTVAGMPGREVEGLDYRYFEPDADGLARLLGGAPVEEAVSVEVQNGSGAVGVAQQVSEVLAPLGYTMLPPRNAEGFPDVETTQINAGAAVLGEADRIRGLLGVGKVVQQDSLPPMQIIIVVGKDLDAASLPASTEG